MKSIKNMIRKILKKFSFIKFALFGYNQCAFNLLNQQRAYKKLKKMVKKYSFPTNDYSSIELSNKVWIYWNKGIENAPELIQKCYASIRKNLKDREIIVLNDKNLSEYIKLPEYIVKKYNAKKMSPAHYSDILRISLLAKYGGCWLDSTVFCSSGEIPNYYFNQKLFVYKTLDLDRSDRRYLYASSWLISACRENNIIVSVRDLLYKYWIKHNKIYDYFLVHILFTLVTEHYQEEFAEIPYYPNNSPHLLMFNLEKKYNQTQWEIIKRHSVFHKLNRQMFSDDPESFYQMLIQDKLE